MDPLDKLLAVEAMLNRRGYELVQPVQPNSAIWTVYRRGGTEPLLRLTTDLIALIDLPKLPRGLDHQLAMGQHHMRHACGCPLLRLVTHVLQYSIYRPAVDGPHGPITWVCPECEGDIGDETVEEIVDPEIMEQGTRSEVE